MFFNALFIERTYWILNHVDHGIEVRCKAILWENAILMDKFSEIFVIAILIVMDLSAEVSEKDDCTLVLFANVSHEIEHLLNICVLCLLV